MTRSSSLFGLLSAAERAACRINSQITWCAYSTGVDRQKWRRTARPGQPAPCIIPFSTTPQAALAAFKAYQRHHCFQLHAINLLGSEYKLVPAYLPFWLFEATISAEARATLGRRADKSDKNSPMVWRKMDDWEAMQHRKQLQPSEHCMQVYASYQLRRDLADAAKPSSLAAAQQLSRQQLDQGFYIDSVAGHQARVGPQLSTAAAAAAGAAAADKASKPTTSSSSSSSSGGQDGNNTSSSTTSSTTSSNRSKDSTCSSSSSSGRQQPSSAGTHHVLLEEPGMRQAIAWELCHRAIMHQQIQQAAQHLKATRSADAVMDLRVRLQVHSRSARLAFFPAYHLSYIQGERYTPSRADIVPAEYEALVGGGAEARVMAELHPSPWKAQALVVGLGLGVLSAVPLTSAALGWAQPAGTAGLPGWGGAESALLAVLAASAAGAMAARLPLIARNRHTAEQVEADKNFYKQYDQQESAPGSPPDEHTLWLWKDADWRQWERDDKWHWDPLKRQAWAERLFRQHAQRDLDREAAEQQQKQQSQQRAEEEEREAQRQQKFGRHRRFASKHHGEGEAGTRPHHQQQQQRRRRDFLGYYKALGIDLEETGASIGIEHIKARYKAAALKLHPDRHVTADEATQHRQAEKFRRLQLAYETLRDPEKRRAYDQGRLVQ